MYTRKVLLGDRDQRVLSCQREQPKSEAKFGLSAHSLISAMMTVGHESKRIPENVQKKDRR